MVIRGATVILAAIAAVAVMGFVTLYLGGYPAAFAHERIALAPLIAGLGAAVLAGYRRGSISRLTSAAGVILLVGWVLFLRILG
jgi:hypothetical protein